MPENIKYQRYQEEQLGRFEEICARCGRCCGSDDGDPCANLIASPAAGKYYCRVYPSRFGPQRTVSGKTFTCVPIRGLIKIGALREGCAYKTNR
jgi:hypothetical protein